MTTQKRNHETLWETYAPALQASVLFEGIQPQERSAMLQCLQPRVEHREKGEILAMQGDPFLGIGCVLRGQVAILKENYAGERVLLTLVGEGGLFGEMAAFTTPRWPATVQAPEDCTVLFLPPDKITGTCAHACAWHRTLTTNLLRVLSRKALLLNRKLEYAAIKTMRGKLCAFLLDVYAQQGNPMLTLDMNRNELADYLGVSRPSMSREMGRMRDEGLIDFHLSTVRIKDIDKLKKMVE